MRLASCKRTTKFGKRSLLHVFNASNNESEGVCMFMHLARHTSNTERSLLNRVDHLDTLQNLQTQSFVSSDTSMSLIIDGMRLKS